MQDLSFSSRPVPSGDLSVLPPLAVSMEFGRAVWLRFHPSAYPPCPHPSFVAHLGGVAVGITLGVVVLRNYEQRLQDQSLWWIFVAMYTVFVLFAVFWNIFAYTLLDLKLPPPPYGPEGPWSRRGGRSSISQEQPYSFSHHQLSEAREDRTRDAGLL